VLDGTLGLGGAVPGASLGCGGVTTTAPPRFSSTPFHERNALLSASAQANLNSLTTRGEPVA
jgi:hypothetical protein